MHQCYYPVTLSEEILSGTHNINWTKNANKTLKDLYLSLTTSLFATKANVVVIIKNSSNSCSNNRTTSNCDIKRIANIKKEEVVNEDIMTIKNFFENATAQIFDNNYEEQNSELEIMSNCFSTILETIEAIKMSFEKISISLSFMRYTFDWYFELLQSLIQCFISKNIFAKSSKKYIIFILCIIYKLENIYSNLPL